MNTLQERDAYIQQYQHLVPITAAKLRVRLPATVERGDLIAAGNLGLLKAATQFDPKRGVLFQTYAITLIRGAILEMLRTDDWVPRTVRGQANQIREAVATLEAQLHRLPTEAEIAAHCGITMETLGEWRRLNGQGKTLSIEEALCNRQQSYADLLPSDDTALWEGLVTAERTRCLQEALARLPEREREAVRLLYQEGRTFREIGEILGRSESRAYQLHQQALKRLRKALEAEHREGLV